MAIPSHISTRKNRYYIGSSIKNQTIKKKTSTVGVQIFIQTFLNFNFQSIIISHEYSPFLMCRYLYYRLHRYLT